MTTVPQASIFLLTNWLITDFYDYSHNRQKRFQRFKLTHHFFSCNSIFYDNIEAEFCEIFNNKPEAEILKSIILVLKIY